MNKVSVFRSGIVAAPAERGCEAEVYSAVDSMRPAGHPTRTQGIFASPRIDGVIRWLRGNHFCGFSDVAVREITLDADTAMVYRINDWERTSSVYDWKREDLLATAAAKYFGDAMTLTQWLSGDYKADEWEVIFPAESVISVRNVSVKRLMTAADSDYTANEIKGIYRHHSH